MLINATVLYARDLYCASGNSLDSIYHDIILFLKNVIQELQHVKLQFDVVRRKNYWLSAQNEKEIEKSQSEKDSTLVDSRV